MKNKTPVKRNPNLMVFSHEHHHGLIFSVRLKSANQTNAETLKLYVEDFWSKYLSSHFALEEKLFCGFLIDEKISNQFFNEHEEIRKLIDAIKNSKNDFAELAARLGEALNAHIRFEERTMFPYLEETLEKKDLKIIGTALASIQVEQHRFEPEFWK